MSLITVTIFFLVLNIANVFQRAFRAAFRSILIDSLLRAFKFHAFLGTETFIARDTSSRRLFSKAPRALSRVACSTLLPWALAVKTATIMRDDLSLGRADRVLSFILMRVGDVNSPRQRRPPSRLSATSASGRRWTLYGSQKPDKAWSKSA